MTNLKYKRSRKKEYLTKQQLEKEGYYAIRSAGSHGFADVVGIKPASCSDPNHYEVRFIQIKSSQDFKEKKTDYLIYDLPFFSVNLELMKFPARNAKRTKGKPPIR